MDMILKAKKFRLRRGFTVLKHQNGKCKWIFLLPQRLVPESEGPVRIVAEPYPLENSVVTLIFRIRAPTRIGPFSVAEHKNLGNAPEVSDRLPSTSVSYGY
jgi:hypothetical protein